MPSKDHPIVSSHRDAATRIFTYLNVEHGIKLKPIVALEVLARALGVANWQTLKAMAEQGRAPRQLGGHEGLDAVLAAEDELPAVTFDGTPEEIVQLLLQRAGTASLPILPGLARSIATEQTRLGPGYGDAPLSAVHDLFSQPVSLLVQKGFATNKLLRILIRTMTAQSMDLFSNLNTEEKDFTYKLKRLNYAEMPTVDLDLLLLGPGALENYAALAPLLRALSPTCRVVLLVRPDYTGRSPEATQILQALRESPQVHQYVPGAVYSLEDPIEYPIAQVAQVSIPRYKGQDNAAVSEGLSRTAGVVERMGSTTSTPRARPWLPARAQVRDIPSKTPGRGFIHYAPGFSSDSSSGKWCIFRNEESVDETWDVIARAIANKRLVGALVSCKGNAEDHGGSYVICVFTRSYADRADVMAARETLRELGVTEELKYKRDIETFNNVYGVPEEWYYTA